jgi:hypothetical protein
MKTSLLTKLSLSTNNNIHTYPESDNSEGKHLYNIDDETIPDEEFFKQDNNQDSKKRSWPNEQTSKISQQDGPNINIKFARRSYSSIEEKCYFYNKIKIKQKTEVSRNLH